MNQLKILFVFLLLSACAPYAKGPVFTKENAKSTFGPLIEFMEIKPGMAVADVGAGSGVLTVIMATQLDSCTVYIQDIDKEVLQKENIDKVIAHYSKQVGYNLGHRNQFQIVYGTVTESKLQNQSIDVMYLNATVHVFDAPDNMLQDLRMKLKPTGRIFIRDSFKGDHDEGEFCTAEDCGKRLLTIDEFLALMKKNGFHLIKQSPDLSGYPVFGFERA
jgi:precorrin-6B methylase 2